MEKAAPWIGSAVGFIIGVVIILADRLTTVVPTLTVSTQYSEVETA